MKVKTTDNIRSNNQQNVNGCKLYSKVSHSQMCKKNALFQQLFQPNSKCGGKTKISTTLNFGSK